MHTVDDAERGRRAFGERRWREAYEGLSEADRQTTLAAADLDLLGTAAYLIGDDDASGELLARAHRAYLDSGQVERAARCAFWLGLRLSDAGQPARGKGWLARASRDIGARDCV
ncbi:MAG: helix-turn-helix transcriptional regulator, partial [Nocardioidaceae bacterium]